MPANEHESKSFGLLLSNLSRAFASFRGSNGICNFS